MQEDFQIYMIAAHLDEWAHRVATDVVVWLDMFGVTAGQMNMVFSGGALLGWGALRLARRRRAPVRRASVTV